MVRITRKGLCYIKKCCRILVLQVLNFGKEEN